MYGVSKKLDGKMFIFRVNLGMWPSNRLSWKNETCSEGFNTHLWGFQGDRWEIDPQIDHLGKMSPVQNVSTHIYGVSNEIDGKTFIFRVNLGMWPSNWSSWESEPCSEGFNTHLWGFQGDRWENIHFLSKPRQLILKLIVLQKQALFWGFQHTCMGFPRR